MQIRFDVDIDLRSFPESGFERFFHLCSNVVRFDDRRLPGAVEVSTGLFANGDFDMLLDFLKSDSTVQKHVKFLIGYSGWSAGQLDGELKQESWAVTTMSSPGDCLAAEGDAFWREIVKGMGDGYKLWLNSPQEPSLN